MESCNNICLGSGKSLHTLSVAPSAGSAIILSQNSDGEHRNGEIRARLKCSINTAGATIFHRFFHTRKRHASNCRHSGKVTGLRKTWWWVFLWMFSCYVGIRFVPLRIALPHSERVSVESVHDLWRNLGFVGLFKAFRQPGQAPWSLSIRTHQNIIHFLHFPCLSNEFDS